MSLKFLKIPSISRAIKVLFKVFFIIVGLITDVRLSAIADQGFNLTYQDLDAHFSKAKPSKSSSSNLPHQVEVGCPKNMKNYFDVATFPGVIRKLKWFGDKYGTNNVEEMCGNYSSYFLNGISPKQVTSETLPGLRALRSELQHLKTSRERKTKLDSYNSAFRFYKVPYKENFESLIQAIDAQIEKANEVASSKCPVGPEEVPPCKSFVFGRIHSVHNYMSCNGKRFVASNANNWTMALNKVLLYCTITGKIPNTCDLSPFFFVTSDELPDHSAYEVKDSGELYLLNNRVLEEDLSGGAITLLELCILKEYCKFIPDPVTNGAPYLVDCKQSQNKEEPVCPRLTAEGEFSKAKNDLTSSKVRKRSRNGCQGNAVFHSSPIMNPEVYHRIALGCDILVSSQKRELTPDYLNEAKLTQLVTTLLVNGYEYVGEYFNESGTYHQFQAPGVLSEIKTPSNRLMEDRELLRDFLIARDVTSGSVLKDFERRCLSLDPTLRGPTKAQCDERKGSMPVVTFSIENGLVTKGSYYVPATGALIQQDDPVLNSPVHDKSGYEIWDSQIYSYQIEKGGNVLLDVCFNRPPGSFFMKPTIDTALVVAGLDKIKNDLPLKFNGIDVGTGSGAIGMRLAQMFGGAKVVGVDIDPNAHLYMESVNQHLNFRSVAADAVEYVDTIYASPPRIPIVIVSNPPYVPTIEETQKVLSVAPKTASFWEGTHLITYLIDKLEKDGRVGDEVIVLISSMSLKSLGLMSKLKETLSPEGTLEAHLLSSQEIAFKTNWAGTGEAKHILGKGDRQEVVSIPDGKGGKLELKSGIGTRPDSARNLNDLMRAGYKKYHWQTLQVMRFKKREKDSHRIQSHKQSHSELKLEGSSGGEVFASLFGSLRRELPPRSFGKDSE